MQPTEHLATTAELPEVGAAVSPRVWLLAIMLSIAMIGLNHQFDVAVAQLDKRHASEIGIDTQAKFEKDVTAIGMPRKVGFVLLLATGVLALLGSRPQIEYQFNEITLLAGITLTWVFGSWIWSDDPTETFHELIRLSGFMFTAAALVRRCRIHELIFIFLVTCLVSIVFALGMEVAAGMFRPWSNEYRMAGSLHPNQLPRLATVVAMIACVALMQGRRRATWLILLAACVVIVWMCRSRSGMVCFAAGLTALYFIGMPRRHLAFSGLVLLVVLAIGGMLFATAPSYVHRNVEETMLMGRTEGAKSLTGRVPLWQETWRDGSLRPWTGFGYGAYWITDRIEDLGRQLEWFPTHAHSAYMEVLLDLGIVGLSLVLLLAVVSISAYSGMARATGRLEYRLLGGVIVAGLANGILEVAFVSPRFAGLFTGIAVFALIIRHQQATAASAEPAEARAVQPLIRRMGAQPWQA